VSLPTPTVFIGPMGAGKSTTARALATRTGQDLVPLDAIRWYYHLTDGFSFTEEPQGQGFLARVRHWEPFSIRAVERALAEFPDAIHDFGAGHAHYTDPARVERLAAALAPVPNVVLLLPFADLDRTERVCRERDEARLGPEYDPTRAGVNTMFVRSPVFRRVATHTVFVEGRPVDAVVEELLRRLAG
jgi:hypothetical protein